MPFSTAIGAFALSELPQLEDEVALHGARVETGPALGINDDLWIIAIIIMVYEK